MAVLHLIIYGKVQGVYYRDSAVATARELGVKGWVRNRNDGTVEAVVCGEVDAVQAFVVWAHRGSPASRVDRVEQQELADAPELLTFERRSTA
ncbi:acylphosphatase [Crenobacter sp. SG2305]|uniref:acylphosphatase n=1 Tax=Crenobacter oryzisoli TaxID=3056844 RepID=UPI0025AACD60|nr:acylphosphatase [Crenobacter sp. SG2305]MDN0081757.1 acylphosphatase [Crenobacter sp. SG2305]